MAIDFRSSSLPNPVDLGMQRPFLNLKNEALPPHSSHPAFGHLILLVFEAVLEVVCVSFPGYVVARQGMFNAEMQKFAANLNVVLFTPCLSKSFRIPMTRSHAHLCSLHKTCISAHRGQAPGACGYPCYIRCSDACFLRLLNHRLQAFPFQETTSELRCCDGGTIVNPICVPC